MHYRCKSNIRAVHFGASVQNLLSNCWRRWCDVTEDFGWAGSSFDQRGNEDEHPGSSQTHLPTIFWSLQFLRRHDSWSYPVSCQISTCQDKHSLHRAQSMCNFFRAFNVVGLLLYFKTFFFWRPFLVRLTPVTSCSLRFSLDGVTNCT